MYPHERSLVSRYKGRPFALLGVNSDNDRESLKRVIAAQGITWRSWFDRAPDGPISTTWQIEGWPTIYVIDHRGIIRYVHVRDDALEDAVEKLVREAERVN